MLAASPRPVALWFHVPRQDYTVAVVERDMGWTLEGHRVVAVAFGGVAHYAGVAVGSERVVGMASDFYA